MKKNDKYPTIKKNDPNNQEAQQILATILLNPDDLVNGQFRIIEEIHNSQLSKIYLAEDNKTNKLKALKIFGKYHDIQPYYDYLRMNATLLCKLNHPNIVKINQFIDSDFVFMDMEFIDGNTLSELIYQKTTDRSQLLPYAIQIAKALSEAHKNNIYHLDLKPGNILVNKQNIIKVIDFSHQQLFGGIQKSSIYTPEYLPPEFNPNQNDNNNDQFLHIQQDIFAYGVTLYEMIYKKLPFKTINNQALDYQLPRHLKKSKKPIDKIIKKCIFLYPEDRYQSFDEILSELKRIKPIKSFSFKSLKRVILKKTSLKKTNPQFKKDLKHLWMALLLLLLVMPFYLIMQTNMEIPDKEVEIDASPLSVFVNMNYAGETPLTTKLTKDDHIEFKDDQGNSIFETHYQNQKKLNLSIKKNKIYLNRKLKGQIIESVNDLPLKRNLEYIRTKIHLSRKDYKIQKNKELILNLPDSFDHQDLSEIPLNTRFINLNKNKRLKSLRDIFHLKNLDGLNLEDTTINTNELKHFKNLKHLNLRKSRLNRISPLLMNDNLKNLNISETPLKDINAIDNLKKLEHVTLSADSLISIKPLLKIPSLKTVSTNSNLTSPTDQADIIKALNQNQSSNINRKKMIIKKRNYFNLIIFFLVTFIMASIIFLILKLIFKKTRQSITVETKEDYPDDNKDSEQNNTKKYGKREIDFVKKAIEDKRFYTPPKENALFYLSALLQSNPQDQELIDLKNEVMNTLKNKTDLHLSHSEYEAVYQISDACNQFFPDSNHCKQLKYIQKKLVRNYPVKLVKVRGGEFIMGDFTIQYSDKGNPAHNVIIDSFRISQTVITNRQFCEFLNTEGNQKEYGVSWYNEESQYARIEKIRGKYRCKEPYGDFPVYDVNWFGAKRYCEWKGGRLPSEAEWEFAARSRGKELIYSFGNTLEKERANYLMDANDTLWHSVFPVKSFKPNKIKLYEMSGNILEWCNDWYDKYYYDFSPDINPKGPDSGEMKVVRGGAWCFGTEQMKTFYRGSAKPFTRNNFIGFRLLIPERKD